MVENEIILHFYIHSKEQLEIEMKIASKVIIAPKSRNTQGFPSWLTGNEPDEYPGE